MKIAFNRQDPDSTLGPYVFLNRLVRFLKTQKDVEVVKAGRYHDLHFITISGSCRRADQFHAKKVLRIDGIYHDSSRNSEKDNESIRSTYHNVDGVIYQCQFAQDMLHKHFGPPQKAEHETIIYNGVGDMFSPRGEKKNYGFRHTLLASARWQSHKRLSSIIDTFLHLNREDVGLVILGETSEKVEHTRIKYLGTLPPHDLPSYYRGADIMLHYAFVDWCPNSVVEGIKSGLPVITTHNGGTRELVKGNGIIIKGDPDYNMEFLDFQKLPKVQPILGTEAIDILLHNRESFVKSRPDLTIENCGKQYLDFFKRVLSK